MAKKSNYTRQTKQQQQQPVLDFIVVVVVAAVDTLTALAAFELQPICLSELALLAIVRALALKSNYVHRNTLNCRAEWAQKGPLKLEQARAIKEVDGGASMRHPCGS